MNLLSIQASEVHLEGMKKFEAFSRGGILEEDYVAQNFDGFWIMNGSLGAIYIAKQGKRKTLEDQENLYIYQVDKEGKPLGYAEIGEVPSLKKKYTYLYFVRAIQKEVGFATEIIPILGELSVYFFKKPLNSSSVFGSCVDNSGSGELIKPVEKIFQRLLVEGGVKREPNGSFTFIRKKIENII